MKTRKLFAVAIISLVAAMPGCGGDDDDNSASGGLGGRGGASGSTSRGGSGGSGGSGGAKGGATAAGGTAGRGGATQTGSGGASAGNAGRGGATQTGSGGRSGSGSGGRGFGGSSPGGAGEAGGGAGGWMQGGESGGGAGGSGGEVVMLTDAEILQIAIVANDGEVAEGELAIAKASHDTVKAFAQDMIDDHTVAAADARALATTTGITPMPSTVSTALQAQAEATVAALNTIGQPAFDSAYMAAQVNAHQSVLVLVNDGLLPQADNANLRAYLLSMRTSVGAHLAAATQIAADL